MVIRSAATLAQSAAPNQASRASSSAAFRAVVADQAVAWAPPSAPNLSPQENARLGGAYMAGFAMYASRGFSRVSLRARI